MHVKPYIIIQYWGDNENGDKASWEKITVNSMTHWKKLIKQLGIPKNAKFYHRKETWLWEEAFILENHTYKDRPCSIKIYGI